MKARFCLIFLLAATPVLAPVSAPAAVVFRSGERTKKTPLAPGEEEVNGSAQQLFEAAQEAEHRSDLRGAIKAYRTIYRRYPKDTLAPGAVYRMAELQEKTRDYLKAADSYKIVVEKYPGFNRFNEAIEAQFRIGEMYLAGRAVKLLGITVRTSADKSIDIFTAIVATAPYGKYTARAQFDIGLAREKQNAQDLAIQAYQAVVEKFPDNPIAADAQYQIGYIWLKAAQNGTNDARAAENAKIGFQDFLFRYPHSEKSAQAKENLRRLEQKQTTNAFQVARFYDKQKNYRAAVIYYNDVLRQQPGSAEGDRAKKRIGELRAKVGEAALQPPAVTAATAKKPKGKETAATASQSESSMHASPNEVAPLPPPETDVSLPPPASLMPDTTTAPVADSSVPSPGNSAPPEPTATPSE